MDEPVPGNATVRRLLVGTRLRLLREQKGITRQEAGYVIRASESKMSRLELGRVSFKDRDIADLLLLYGVADPVERQALVTLAREASRPDWWREYEDVTPNWFTNYIGLEEAAVGIRTYEVAFIPGLLQTPAYARAVIASAVPRPDRREVDRAAALREIRQRVLVRPEPPHLWAVVDESALRRPIGDEAVTREQVQHLVELAQRPGVALQILPLRYGSHAPAGGAFTLLRFADPALPDVVYLEQLLTASYLDKIEHVDRYTQVLSQLSVESLTPHESIDLLTGLLADLGPPRLDRPRQVTSG